MDSTKRKFTSREKLYKWLCYSALLFVLYIFQSVGLMPEIFGTRPSFLLAAPVCIAICEGALPGAVTGAVCGILIDTIQPGLDGFFSFFLVILCGLTGMLVISVMRNTIITALFLSSVSVITVKLSEWFFFVWFAEVDKTAFRFVNYTLPSMFYTVLMTAPVYFLVLWIKSKFDVIKD